jgi:hypothetical protein
VLVLASGATTLILAFVLAASTAMVPGSHRTVGFGSMLVGFTLGSAAGGPFQCRRAAVLARRRSSGYWSACNVAAAEAVQVVLIFCLLTFWLLAMVGIVATRQLRSRRVVTSGSRRRSRRISEWT